MNSSTASRILAWALSLALLAAPVSPSLASAPTGAGFTYQGQLTLNSEPVTGRCDFQFTLYSDPTTETALGPTQSQPDLPITGGLFNTVLGFGSEAFDGQPRWLEVAVRCPAGNGEFTILAPRQALTPTPYALRAASTPWSGLSGVPDWIANGPYSAGRGLTLSGSTFQVDTGVIQSRVTGACPAGEYVQAVNQDGTVVCGVDANPMLTPGDGLTLNGQTLALDASVARVADVPALVGASGFITQSMADTLYQLTPGDGLERVGNTLQVLTDTVQARVHGLCSEGAYVRQINPNGSVVCGLDADTLPAAGDGLTLDGQTLSVSPSIVRVADIQATVSAAGFITGTLANDLYQITPGDGLARTGNTLSVVTTTVQARVADLCAAGAYIRQINADGSVVCGLDADSGGDITSVSAGIGLSGGAENGSAPLSVAPSYQLPQSCAAGQVPVSDGTGGWTCQSPIPSRTIAFFAQSTCPAGWSEVTALRGRALVGLPASGTINGTVGSPLANLGTRSVTLSTANLPAHSHDVNPEPVATGSGGDHAHSVDPAAVAATTSTSGAHTHGAQSGNLSGIGGPTDPAYPGLYSSTSGIWGYNTTSSAGSHNHSVTVDIPATSSSTAGAHSHSVDVPNTTSTSTGSGTALDVTMPYLQLLACGKN